VTRDVLNRPEFQPETVWDWSLGAGHWLAEVLRVILHKLQASPAVSWVVLGIAACAVCGLLLRLLFEVNPGIFSLHRPRQQQTVWGTAVRRTLEEQPPEHELLHAAQEALRQGDGYGAIWLLHRLLVHTMAEQGLLARAPWKTNADYLRECPRAHAAYPLFADLTRAYEHIIYAHRPVPLTAVAALLTRVEHAQPQQPA
jgi:hypothetical protein